VHSKPGDDQVSIILALSISSNPCNPSFIRSFASCRCSFCLYSHWETHTLFFFTPLLIPGVDLYYTRPTLGFSLSFSKHQSNLAQSHKGRHRDAWTELVKGYLIASASSIWTFCLVKLLINIFSIFIINQEQFTKLLKISMQAAVYFCYLKD